MCHLAGKIRAPHCPLPLEHQAHGGFKGGVVPLNVRSPFRITKPTCLHIPQATSLRSSQRLLKGERVVFFNVYFVNKLMEYVARMIGNYCGIVGIGESCLLSMGILSGLRFLC